jgi:PAS domain S-box-containing protein
MTIQGGFEQVLPGLGALFASHPLPMWVYDVESLAFLAVNPAAVDHYGWSEAEFLGMTLRDIRPAEEVEQLGLRVRSLGDQPATSRGWRHRTRSGRIIDADIYSLPVTYRNRAARLVLALDVTDRRMLEAELAQAQRLEAVGRLAGGIAHDFNNLLTTMASGLDLLEADLTDGSVGTAGALADLHTVRDAVVRAGDVTRKLLALARRQVLRLELHEPGALIRDVAPLLRTLAGSRIRLEFDLAADLPPIRGDATQVEQVLLNLAVNAKDAMPEGGQMTLATGRRELGAAEAARLGLPEGHFVELAVSDTGSGMTPEVAAQIFEPFFTTKPVGKGTGLGLATVHGIMRQHGGAVTVRSSPGSGSRFALLFPAQERPAPGDGAPVVLLVDDDPAVRGPVARILRRNGFDVLEAGGGTEALELWSRRGSAVAAAVLDVVMPGMTGPSLLRELRRRRPGLPGLLVTGFSADAVRQHGELELDTVLLEKPFDTATLLDRVRALIPAAAAS